MEPEGGNNYIAKLAALIDVFNAEEEGGRVMVVFDATSPVRGGSMASLP